jgi:hypothetical protein
VLLNNHGSQVLNISGVNIHSIYKSAIDQNTITLEKNIRFAVYKVQKLEFIKRCLWYVYSDAQEKHVNYLE